MRFSTPSSHPWAERETKTSLAVSWREASEEAVVPPRRPNPFEDEDAYLDTLPPPILMPEDAEGPIDFGNAEAAFRSKRTSELVRALVVFRLCGVPWLVSNAGRILAAAQSVVGTRVTNALVRHTFFGHFCAGETAEGIMPTVDRLRASNVGSILDYAAEADVDTAEAPAPSDDAEATDMTGRALPEDIEEDECDRNVDIFLQCIKAAAQFDRGFAAIKVTALGRPADLERITEVIRGVRGAFARFDADGSGVITYDEFSGGLDRLLDPPMDEAAKRALFDQFDVDGNGAIDQLEWTEYLRVEQLGHRPVFAHLRRDGGNDSGGDLMLNAAELRRAVNMMERLRRVAKAAADARVRLMVDAEQTYFQPAISHAVLNLQREFNRDYPAIFNTYQAYLRDCLETVEQDMLRARREGFYFAGKLVRGAYMVSERRRARELGEPDPIWSTIERTHRCYHACLDHIMRNMLPSAVMVASHNETTVRYTVACMERLGIHPVSGGVYFGQLLGMCDHISLALGQAGREVNKYLPYGPVHEVVPYLIRRAEENSSLLGSGATAAESALIWKELRRRAGL